MNLLLRIPYAAAGAIARAAAAVAPARGGKIISSLRARRGIRARFAMWSGRETTRPLIWFHAPSVGEGLQARPVIARVRKLVPEAQIAYTFFSPSAEKFASHIGADFCDYIPFDTRADARAAIDALRPTALVFSKLDVWPVLAESAAARGVSLGLISATLAGRSSRRSAFGTLLLGDAYRALDAVGAISAEDAARLQALGVRAERVSVTGDTRYDEAWARARANDQPGAMVKALESDRPTLVAGSTWPADEEVLLAAWLAVREKIPGARLVIAPHEPTPAHLEPVARWANRAGLAFASLGDAVEARADVVLVNRVGMLGDLYALADVAYVGGGFHSAGLHSVIEPAAFGVPVLFGPRHTSSRDAELLLENRGGFNVRTAGEISARVCDLFADAAMRDAAGARARALVEGGLGAAERSAALVQRLVARDGAAIERTRRAP